MASQPRKFNSSRRLAPEGHYVPSQLTPLLQSIQYSGNSVHKRNPGDFNLTPSSAARQNKSLCDDTGIFTRKEALYRLKEGLRRGITCARFSKDGWPKHIWSMMEDGRVLEAKRDNVGGNYHGYPIKFNDPLAIKVRKRWPNVQPIV